MGNGIIQGGIKQLVRITAIHLILDLHISAIRIYSTERWTSTKVSFVVTRNWNKSIDIYFIRNKFIIIIIVIIIIIIDVSVVADSIGNLLNGRRLSDTS